LDYDGTLAPIVADPAAARPLPGLPELLARLAGRLAVVAVISGRPVSFLLDTLEAARGVRLFGLYGMERVTSDGAVQVAPAVERWRPVVAAVAERAGRTAPAGLEVEAKGLTVTLHWRRAPEAGSWARAFGADEAERVGLVLQPGRMALELRPPVPLDKGTVVAELGRGRSAAAYIGDDAGDLPAFAALGDLTPGGVEVARVAVADPEGPASLVEAADVVLAGPAEVVALLHRLLAAAGG
jgi:trehalose 6-phosphate phosphatase